MATQPCNGRLFRQLSLSLDSPLGKVSSPTSQPGLQLSATVCISSRTSSSSYDWLPTQRGSVAMARCERDGALVRDVKACPSEFTPLSRPATMPMALRVAAYGDLTVQIPSMVAEWHKREFPTKAPHKAWYWTSVVTTGISTTKTRHGSLRRGYVKESTTGNHQSCHQQRKTYEEVSGSRYH